MSAWIDPVVKWVGGKRRIIDELLSRMPSNYVDYYELFAGGAALRLALPHLRYAVVADANHNLISTYSLIVSDCNAVLQQLNEFSDEYRAGNESAQCDMYYRVRAEFNANVEAWSDGAVQAARFMFLNKTGFNGLYRESSSGFNVSFGKNSKPLIVPPNLQEFKSAIATTKLMHGDFRQFIRQPTGGDLVYCDPPYDGTYDGYTACGFGTSDLADLAKECQMLDARGVFLMVSNSDTELVRSLFKGFRIETIMAPRSVNRDGNSRAKAPEVIIRNY